ncbi:hypothetical protein GTQ43_33380 [Nostoc sp. KVJ3]|uniref:hypothetical protein n=1 Tax=Nostoc sp. KVJ3 TaxID=457945 RepID=UPI0022378B38|nr:hypothetical protein [Nostoc sp. KVJ3]MCW5318435.1 hypothetical protein [Nostoc sp. KVJ3]
MLISVVLVYGHYKMVQTINPYNPFVYIVESPRDDDLLYERTEGKALTEALKLCGIISTYSLTCSKRMFKEALTSRLKKDCHDKKRFPIIHFSVHGCEQGIGLTNEELVSWNELRQLLIPLNREMQGGLLVCFSSCFGAYSCLMEFNNQIESSFGTTVGHNEKVSWSNSAVAYISFYNRLFQGASIKDCVEAMRKATGDDNFEYFESQIVKQAYLADVSNRIRNQNLNSHMTFLGDIF